MEIPWIKPWRGEVEGEGPHDVSYASAEAGKIYHAEVYVKRTDEDDNECITDFKQTAHVAIPSLKEVHFSADSENYFELTPPDSLTFIY